MRLGDGRRRDVGRDREGDGLIYGMQQELPGLQRDRAYQAAEIKRRAEGGVDYAAHVAAETAKRDRYRLALAVNEALATATMEQMQAALAALKGAS